MTCVCMRRRRTRRETRDENNGSDANRATDGVYETNGRSLTYGKMKSRIAVSILKRYVSSRRHQNFDGANGICAGGKRERQLAEVCLFAFVEKCTRRSMDHKRRTSFDEKSYHIRPSIHNSYVETVFAFIKLSSILCLYCFREPGHQSFQQIVMVVRIEYA